MLIIDSNLQSISLVVEVKVKIVLSFKELNKLLLTSKVESQERSVFEVEVRWFQSKRLFALDVSDSVSSFSIRLNLEISIMICSLDRDVESVRALRSWLVSSEAFVKVLKIVS